MGPPRFLRTGRFATVLMRAQLAAICVISVSAGPAFAALELSTDHRPLFFGLMRLGEEKTLAESGTFHHEITCSSSGGATWYLKIHLLQPLSSGAEDIPLDRFQWQLTRTDGNGSVVTSSQFRSFTLAPDLVYISGPGEAGGTKIHLQFRYALTIPDTQVTGVYHTTIRFTLTELL